MESSAYINRSIDDLLKWENESVILKKIRRNSLLVPDRDLIRHTDPENGMVYYTYLWSIGNAPENVNIEIEVDRYRPGDAVPRKSRMHNHDFFEIVYVYRGSCSCTVSGKTADLSAGDICLYNLQAVHCVTKLTEETVIFNLVIKQEIFLNTFREMMSQNDLLTGFYLNSIYNIDRPVSKLVLKPDISFHCENIIQTMILYYYKDVNMCQDRLKALLILLFAEVSDQIRKDPLNPANSISDNSDPLTDILNFINTHLSDITPEMLANKIGYSVRTLQRFLRDKYHSSYSEIVSQVRSREACRLLRETAMSSNDIALRTGFSEHSSFERAFKRRFRITPNEYRKQYRCV